jgi:DNA-binding response OmpR family regulator
MWVTDGDSALRTEREFGPDLIILDITLPGRSGFDLFEPLHQRRRTPIIILTARGQKADKLLGLSLGADDYVTKPFDLEELLARVQAVLRRSRPTVERLTLGRVTIDFRTRAAMSGKAPLHLTDREFAILEFLAVRHERVVYRDELLRGVWGYADIPATRSVDHAIARLRKKVEADPSTPRFIHTVHGDGYRLNVPPGLL